MAEEKKESSSAEATEGKQEEKKEEAVEAAEESDEEKEVEVPEKFKKLVEEIENMSVLQLSELVKVLEDKFGVSAAAPVAVAGAAAAGAEGAAGGEEKSEFNVELADVGGNKIAVIKAVRGATGLGLKEAKEQVDSAPTVIKENVPKEEAEELKGALEEAGATVNLK